MATVPLKPITYDGSNLVVNGRAFEAENAKNISDWTRSLSPTLASDYDTDFVTLTAPSGATVRARRIGKRIEIKWEYAVSLASGGLIDIFTDASPLPSEWRPSHHTVPATMHGTGGYPMTGAVLTSGRVYARNNHTSALSNHQGYVTFTVA